MSRMKTPFTAAIAASALLTLPLGVLAQTPATQSKPTSTPQASQTAETPQDHLRQAEAALNDLSPTAVPASAKGKITELKQHLNALQRAASANDKASATGAENRSATATSGAKGNVEWSKEVAAIDKIITELLGPAPSPSTTPAPTGTSGTTPKPTATATLDEATRGKLADVRTRVTAFAAAMNKSSSPSDESASPSAAAAAQPPTAATQPPTSSTEPPPASAQPPSSSTQPPSTASQSPTSTTQPPSAAMTPSSAGQSAQTSSATQPGQADQEAAKQHLTASRESLSQMTQLPAASQLTGEARTQVSQLIASFNELITTGSNWRASYAKVEANLNALLGSQSIDESRTPATGTPGAVGTSGTVSAALDPGIKAKLVEFRNHLKEFEKAAGGGSSPDASSAAAASPTSAPSTATSPSSAAAAASTSSTSASTSPTSAMTGATTSAAAPSEPAAKSEKGESMSKDDAMKHIQAIEAILNANASGATGAAAPTGTAGTSAAAGGLVLDKAQVEQLKTHLAELRRIIDQK
jgi:hypothetical protein